MSHPNYPGAAPDMGDPMEQPVPEMSLPMAVHALENDELQALLVALLREWRERVATSQAPHLPMHMNA